MKIGLKNLKLNPCVYIYSEDGIISNLTLYFDDVHLIEKDVAILKRQPVADKPCLNDERGRGVACARDRRYS